MMEVSAVSSLVTSSSNNNNTNINNNTNNNINNSNNNNNDNGNNQLIDINNLQSHQQRAQFIMSTKGINNYIGNSFINTANDVTDSSEPQSIGTNTINNPPIIETENNLTGLSNQELDEINLSEIVELVSRIISQVELQMSSDTNNFGSTASLINYEIDSCRAQSSNPILPKVSLNIPTANQTAELQKDQLPDLSPDEATSDLVIDADIPSSDSQGNTPRTDQSGLEALERNSLDQIDLPSVAKPATKNLHSEQESPIQIDDAPANVDYQASKVTEEHPDEARESIDQDIKTNLVNEENRVPILTEDDPEEDKTKDIVTLRNLEITPPPPPPEDPTMKKESEDMETTRKVQGEKRKRSSVSESTTESGQPVEGGRSKRQRTQTKLFQAGEYKTEAQVTPKISSSRKSKTSVSSNKKGRKGSIAPSIPDKRLSVTQNCVVQQPIESQDVIFYEKDDYLAVRNEENTFYLCQLAENVKADRPLMKIRWLDTKDDGKTYFLTSQYDKVYQKSIIMPVIPNILKSGKKGEQLFTVDDQVKANIMDRLSKSLSAQNETLSNQSGEQTAP